MKLLFILALLLGALSASAAPFVPLADDQVLERLPEKSDPSLKALKRLRAAQAADPRNLDLAAAYARRAIEVSRESGDPRFLGAAQAALAPWWNDPDAPAAALLLRATIRQSQHDFAGALADLDRVIARTGEGQALLTRATVLTVQARYAEARADCARLARRTSALVVATCDAGPASLAGNPDGVYRSLVLLMNEGANDPGVLAWALTLAGEIAARNGDATAADAHFRAARALDPRDAYLKGAYADFLLDEDRPREVLPLLADDTRNDALLLRLALAERQVPEMHAALAAHRDDLAARFDAARRRGDVVHRREEARYRLALAGDPGGALALARDNWAVQREPADLRVLADAARALAETAR
jgi:predicted Zn-dependent protease